MRLQLWQPGFGRLAPIDAPIAQDGSYSSPLFDGDYKLAFFRNDGPWKTVMKDAAARDTIFVNLRGDRKVDIEVMKIITGVDARDIERVSLLISRTQFVSRANNIGITNLDGANVRAKPISACRSMFPPSAPRRTLFTPALA